MNTKKNLLSFLRKQESILTNSCNGTLDSSFRWNDIMRGKFVILFLVLISLSTSACGMKRALTLPDEEEHADLSADLATHQSIDVLKTR